MERDHPDVQVVGQVGLDQCRELIAAHYGRSQMAKGLSRAPYEDQVLAGDLPNSRAVNAGHYPGIPPVWQQKPAVPRLQKLICGCGIKLGRQGCHRYERKADSQQRASWDSRTCIRPLAALPNLVKQTLLDLAPGLVGPGRRVIELHCPFTRSPFDNAQTCSLSMAPYSSAIASLYVVD
ncbi:hypothetical protein [Maritimibacter sp. 55A14]|uniref:hypothetical protein n=1 Tax=Maritimibacter sp. 55A14 TaxID=2174844 RepID=UPI0011B1D802|nr:hypothetical protein [Maritimibacter sp. 55A14]